MAFPEDEVMDVLSLTEQKYFSLSAAVSMNVDQGHFVLLVGFVLLSKKDALL